MPFIHKIMDNLDLSERGRKIYVNSHSFSFKMEQEDENSFTKCIEEICFNHYEELGIGKPVFVYAFSNKSYRLVYFRKGINQISDGEKIYMFDDYISIYLAVQTDKARRVINVGDNISGKFFPIKCYEFKK